MSGQPYSQLRDAAIAAGKKQLWNTAIQMFRAQLRDAGWVGDDFERELRRLMTEKFEAVLAGVEMAAEPEVAKPYMPEPMQEPESAPVLPAEYDDVDLTGLSFQTIIQRDVKWVYLNLGEKNPVDPPSPGAKAWLAAIQRDARAREGFMRDTLPKFLPPAKALEDAERFSDDGRDTLELLDRCKAALG